MANVVMAPIATVENGKANKVNKSATKSSRPVRMCRFEVHEYDIDDQVLELVTPNEPLFKSDVHYCAEKFAIDMMAHNGENDVAFTKLVLYKVSKIEREDGQDTLAISTIYWDEDTKQVVID